MRTDSGSSISFFLLMQTGMDPWVKICGLTWSQKFQDLHISDFY